MSRLSKIAVTSSSSRLALMRVYRFGQSTESQALVSWTGSLAHALQTSLIFCSLASEQLVADCATRAVLVESAVQVAHIFISARSRKITDCQQR